MTGMLAITNLFCHFLLPYDHHAGIGSLEIKGLPAQRCLSRALLALLTGQRHVYFVFLAGGINTASTTWMTPFDAITSVFTTLALFTMTSPALTLILM
jgi:hypothetical protein